MASPSTFLGGENDPGAQAVVLKVFGPDLGPKLAKLLGRGKNDWRKVLEPKEPTAQCDNSVGSFDESGKNKLCYLCGQIIPDKKGRSSSHPLFAECEHILPVTTARWFLTLYMNKSQTKDEWVKTILTYEYAWAHRICNQTKSNELFVVKSGKTASVATETVVKVLDKIQSSATKYRARSPQFLKDPKDMATVDGIIGMNIPERLKTIVEQKLKPIVDHINSYPAEETNFMNLARAAFLMDTDMMSAEAQKLVRDHYNSTIEAYKVERVEEISKQIPAIFASSIPAYTTETLLPKLVAPITSTEEVKLPSTTESAVQEAFAGATNELTAFMRPLEEESTASILMTLGGNRDPPTALYDVTSIHSIVSLFQYRLYSAMWASLDASWKAKNIQFACRLRNILIVTYTNAEKYAKLSNVPPPAFDPATTAMCEKEDAKRVKSTEALKTRLDNMSERQWEKEETADSSVADILVELSQGPFTEPEEYADKEQTKQVQETGRLVDVNIAREERFDAANAERKAITPRYDELASKQTRTPAEEIEMKDLGKRLKALVKIMTENQGSILRGQGRSKQSKTFRRTKPGRRSGPSTRSRRRSYRKSQKGKSSKRTRY